MGAAEKLSYTLDDYFSLEESSKEKYEYVDGEIIAMAGGTAKHAKLAMNMGSALLKGIGDGNCSVYSSDVKVRTAYDFLYPDVTVVCGDEAFAEDEKLALSNPKLVVEVLSDSSERYDRGLKFSKYRSIPSLVQYVLVSQHEPWVETFHRNSDGDWVLAEAKGLEAELMLKGMGFSIKMADVYRKVDFSKKDEPAPEQQ